jgi:peptidoglycan/xylan/chitin deacetylase (PgdA/CDA1 family)
MIGGSPLRVLTYHSIAEARHDRDSVDPELLRAHLRYLTTRGWRSLDPRAFEREVRGLPRRKGPPGYLLTFDDGYADMLSAAWPILGSFGCRPIVFVVTDCVGGTDRFNGSIAPRRMLTWEELRQLQASGVTIGSHSCSHRPLVGLSLAELEREVVGSKARLESELGCRADYFAYPYGASTPVVEACVAQAGYQAAFAGPGPTRAPFRIARTAIGGADSVSRLRLKLSPLYRVARVVSKVRTR